MQRFLKIWLTLLICSVPSFSSGFFDDLAANHFPSRAEESDSASQFDKESPSSQSELRISRYDMRILTSLALLEAGPNCDSGPLDVSQVVFNRLNNPLFPDTIPKIVFQLGQFQPFFGLDGTHPNRVDAQKKVFATDQSAAQFIAKKRKGLDPTLALAKIKEIEEAYADTVAMKNSIQFIDGRSFFLGSTMSFRPDVGDVRRKKGCNHFKYGILSADRARHKPYKEELLKKAPTSVIAGSN